MCVCLMFKNAIKLVVHKSMVIYFHDVCVYVLFFVLFVCLIIKRNEVVNELFLSIGREFNSETCIFVGYK